MRHDAELNSALAIGEIASPLLGSRLAMTVMRLIYVVALQPPLADECRHCEQA
jgi:hypothetical protein